MTREMLSAPKLSDEAAKDLLFAPLGFLRGKEMRNRFMLSPLTNLQAAPDGQLTNDELSWLAMRASGGFGMVTTCAAFVHPVGRGFARQLGVSDDRHIEGLTRLATTIRENGALSSIQLYHAGNRAEALEDRVSASGDPSTGTRALTTNEISAVVESFAHAARRAKVAGFDGVQIHGAHGYLFNQFLAPRFNRRNDRYGGSLENRSRIYFEVLEAIRVECGDAFQVGLRISPDRFDTVLEEDIEFAGQLLGSGLLDYLDLSFSDVRRHSSQPEYAGKPLLSYFTDLPRHGVRLGAAGQIKTAALARELITQGLDYVDIGIGAILHHDFPKKVENNDNFEQRPLPVSAEYLRNQGLGDNFINYMRTWPGFVDGGEIL